MTSHAGTARRRGLRRVGVGTRRLGRHAWLAIFLFVAACAPTASSPSPSPSSAPAIAVTTAEPTTVQPSTPAPSLDATELPTASPTRSADEAETCSVIRALRKVHLLAVKDVELDVLVRDGPQALRTVNRAIREAASVADPLFRSAIDEAGSAVALWQKAIDRAKKGASDRAFLDAWAAFQAYMRAWTYANCGMDSPALDQQKVFGTVTPVPASESAYRECVREGANALHTLDRVIEDCDAERPGVLSKYVGCVAFVEARYYDLLGYSSAETQNEIDLQCPKYLGG